MPSDKLDRKRAVLDVAATLRGLAEDGTLVKGEREACRQGAAAVDALAVDRAEADLAGYRRGLEEAADAREALQQVMAWINEWEPDFIEEPAWVGPTMGLVNRALAAKDGVKRSASAAEAEAERARKEPK